MSIKRLTALLLALILCLGCLAGCSAKQEPAPAEEAAQPAEEVTAPVAEETSSGKPDFSGRTLKLALFEGGYGITCWDNVIAAFKEEYPGVEVEYQSNPKIEDVIRPQIISGDVPDFFYCSSWVNPLLLSLRKEKKLLDLTDVFEGPSFDDPAVALKDNILGGVLESATCSPYGDGRVYAGSLAACTTGLIYNETLFKENGWEVPQTWDEFFALGDKAKEKGIALLTYPGVYPDYMACMISQALASELSAEKLAELSAHSEEVFASDEVKQIFENIGRIGTGGYLLEGTTAMNHTQSQSEFMLGKSLFVASGDWIAQEMKDAPRTDGFVWRMAPCFTSTADKDHYITLAIDPFCIPADAKNADIAKEFVRFLYSDKAAQIFAKDAGMLICTKSAVVACDGLLDPEFLDIHAVDKTVRTTSFDFQPVPDGCNVILSQYIYNPLVDVMNGTMTAAEWHQGILDALAEINAAK